MESFQKTFLIIVFLFCVTSLFAQNKTNLNFSDILIRQGNQEFTGLPATLSLSVGHTSAPVALYSANDITIMAVVNLTNMSSSRSQTKDSGVRMRITYTCVYKNKKENNKQEHMFFKNDKGEYTEKIQFNFEEGLKNKMIEFTCIAKLER